MKSKKDVVVVIFAASVGLSIVMLVASASFAVVENTLDWSQTHIKGPNITTPLATLIGSLVSAVIAGTVGYIGGSRTKDGQLPNMPQYHPTGIVPEAHQDNPVEPQHESTKYPPYTQQPQPQSKHDWESPHR